RQRTFAGDASGSCAGRARIFDHLAAAMTSRAGSLEGEKTLRMPHPALAAAGRAGARPRAGLGTGAGAHLAGDRGWNMDLGGLSRVRLFERDLHVVAQVGAALAAGAAAAPAAHSEQVVEDVGESRGKLGAEPGAGCPRAMLEGSVPEAIIGGALLVVLEDVVGLVDFLELMLAILVAGIAVGVVLHRRLAIGGFKLGLGGGALNSQDVVVIPLGHHRHSPPSSCRRRSAFFCLCRI